MIDLPKRLIAPLITGLCLLFFAFFVAHWLHLFERWVYFDKSMHFTAGLALAFFFARLFDQELAQISIIKSIIVLTGLVCLVGVMWEFIEFISNTFSPTYAPLLFNYLHIGDLADTLCDIVADILGCLSFILIWVKKP